MENYLKEHPEATLQEYVTYLREQHDQWDREEEEEKIKRQEFADSMLGKYILVGITSTEYKFYHITNTKLERYGNEIKNIPSIQVQFYGNRVTYIMHRWDSIDYCSLRNDRCIAHQEWECINNHAKLAYNGMDFIKNLVGYDD